MVLLAVALVAVFGSLHSYAVPGFLQITRPTLTPVPLLWVAVAVGCWRLRATERLKEELSALMSGGDGLEDTLDNLDAWAKRLEAVLFADVRAEIT